MYMYVYVYIYIIYIYIYIHTIYTMYRRLGGGAQRPNREIVALRGVRACARCGCKVGMGLKCHAPACPFSFFPESLSFFPRFR